MAVSVEQIEKYRRWFGWVFLGSFLTLLFLFFLPVPWPDLTLNSCLRVARLLPLLQRLSDF
jgi:hypothetical protein